MAMVLGISTFFALALLQVADTAPTKIHLAYGNDPKSEMTVVWQSKAPSEGGVVQYRTGSSEWKTTHSKRVRYAYETEAIYEAQMRDLSPNASYEYRVGSDAGGWSAVSQFRTAEPNPRQFTFTAFGDHGVTKSAETNLAHILKERPAFHLLLGDISYANGNQPIWDDYLHQLEPMASKIPTMLTLGNHENEEIRVDGKEVSIGYVSYLARFALPQNEEYYWFDYGNVRFVAFNSDDYRDPVQLDWLRDTLSRARKEKSVKWIVVFQHHPPFSSCKGRENNQGVIDTVTPIFDAYKVDLVLSGHNHHYERQFPIVNKKVTTNERLKYQRGKGTVYVVQGGGGKSLYDFVETKPAECAVRDKSYGYLRVKVDVSKGIRVDAIRTDSTPIESFEIRN